MMIVVYLQGRFTEAKLIKKLIIQNQLEISSNKLKTESEIINESELLSFI